MAAPTRRRFLKQTVTAGAAVGLAGAARGAEADAPPGGLDLPVLGRVKPVPSKAITSSPLSVGFETLDRQHFDPTRAYPHLAKLGVKWARCQTGWNRCERKRGRFTFGWLDEVVDSLRDIGIQPWFNLGYGNKLYTPAKPNDFSVGWAPILEPEATEAWLRFVRAIAEHFSDRVQHWEIWNEPNIRGFWKPKKPDPADYVRLVKLTAPQIRERVPKAVIVGGAFAGIPMGYIRGCLDLGLAEQVDCISYHPYRPVPEAGYEGQIRKLQGLLAKHREDLRLWQGENGCPSKGGKGSVGALSNLEWDETRQAKWLLRRILTDLRLSVELTSYFHTVDLVGYRGQTNYKGLLRGSNYEPKLSYGAYQALCALFDSQTRRDPRLTLDLLSGRKVHMQDAGFVRQGRALYAYWFPANLQKGWEARPIDVALAVRPDAALRNPILVDPLHQRVHRLPDAELADGKLTLRSLPLLDYPLLVTDGSVVTDI